MGYKCVYLNLVHTHKLALTYFVCICVWVHIHINCKSGTILKLLLLSQTLRPPSLIPVTSAKTNWAAVVWDSVRTCVSVCVCVPGITPCPPKTTEVIHPGHTPTYTGSRHYYTATHSKQYYSFGNVKQIWNVTIRLRTIHQPTNRSWLT